MATYNPESYFSVPLAELNHKCRKELALYLDPEAGPMAANWKDLAEHMGLRPQEILNIERKTSPTQEVLREYIARTELATVGSLLQILIELKRQDVIEHCKDLIAKDVSDYERRPSQLPEPGECIITTQKYYDAFVSYHSQDQWFAERLIEELEEGQSFKLCIPQRDMLAGIGHNKCVAELMAHRCKRVIILLSTSYLQSTDQFEELEWELLYAQALAPAARQINKLIPIIIEEGVKTPDILIVYSIPDYTKKAQNAWFWHRLIESLKIPTKGYGGYTGPDAPLGRLKGTGNGDTKPLGPTAQSFHDLQPSNVTQEVSKDTTVTADPVSPVSNTKPADPQQENPQKDRGNWKTKMKNFFVKKRI